MLIPKGKAVVWQGVKYRPGQKVRPSHKGKVRALLRLMGSEPIESEPPPPIKSKPKPIAKTEPIEQNEKPFVPPSVENATVIDKTEEITVVETKEKKPRKKSKKTINSDG